MARFCTGCGAPLADASRFCEQCGRQVVSAAVPESDAAIRPAAGADIPGRRARRRPPILAGVAAMLLLVGGGAAYMLMRTAGPPSASEVTRLIQADKKLVEALTCLDNFDYGRSPVRVSQWDSKTQSWLAVLVEAGLYTEPTRVVSGGGFFAQEQLQYERTDVGAKAVHGRKLCYADNVEVDSVKYHEPAVDADPQRASGTARYHLVQPAPWIGTSAAKRALPRKFAGETLEIPLNLVLADGKWQSAGASADGLRSSMRANARATSGQTGGMFAWFGNLFARDPLQVVQGKWVADESAVVVFEFRPSSAVVMGAEIPARYAREGDVVIVQGGSDQSEALRVRVVSNDELRLVDGSSAGMRLVRSN